MSPRQQLVTRRPFGSPGAQIIYLQKAAEAVDGEVREEADFGEQGQGDCHVCRVCSSQTALLTSGREAKLTCPGAPASQPWRRAAAGRAGPLPCPGALLPGLSCALDLAPQVPAARRRGRDVAAGDWQSGECPCGSGESQALGAEGEREGRINLLSSRNSGPRRNTRPGLGALDSQPRVH